MKAFSACILFNHPHAIATFEVVIVFSRPQPMKELSAFSSIVLDCQAHITEF